MYPAYLTSAFDQSLHSTAKTMTIALKSVAFHVKSFNFKRQLIIFGKESYILGLAFN